MKYEFYRKNIAPTAQSISHQTTALSPLPFRLSVRSVPSFTTNNPGNRFSQGLLATGIYCLELASTPATPGTRAAIPTEWISDAPGQVRSCTVRNILYFCAAAAINIACDWPLHAFKATPV